MIHARDDYARIQDPENKIKPEEPVFLIRAQDRTAAAVVRYWVKLNKAALKEAEGLTDAQKAGRKKALTLAEAHAYRMEDWPTKKFADVP